MTILVNNTISHQRNHSLSDQVLQKQTMRWGSMCKWLIKDGLPEGTGREQEGRPGQRRGPKEGAASDKVLRQRQLLLRGTLGSDPSLRVVRPEARGLGFHAPHSCAWWGPPGGVNPQGLPLSIPHVLGSTSSGQGQPSKEELKVRPLEAKGPWRKGREIWKNNRCPGHRSPWRNGRFQVWAGKVHNDPGTFCHRWKQKAVKDNRLCEQVKKPTLRGSHYPETGQFEHQN